MVHLKRIYSNYDTNDGYRILVDRLWPRGISKEKAHVDLWLKEIAPSTELRKWFDHDIEKWDEFKKKYTEELMHSESFKILQTIVNEKDKVTLLFGAKDEKHNQAVVIKQKLLI